jgi:LysR family hydrogen peroxide-inducible transcriptional activator
MDQRTTVITSSKSFDAYLKDLEAAEPPANGATHARPVVATVTDITLRQLQYIVAVADALGFHKAASKCHVSQPALSAQVQQVESLLGVALFERDRRRVMVTAAGHEVVSHARRVLSGVEELLMAATRVRDPLAGTLRIAVISTIAPYLLPEVTLALATQYPKLSLVYREEKTADAVRLLGEGAIDAAILAPEAGIGDCVSTEVARDEFVVAMAKGHPLARKKALTLSDLDDVLVLLLEEGHCFRDQALAACAKVRARECPFRATSLGTLAQMVSNGVGITLLPRVAVPVENRRAQLEIRPFVKPAPARTIALAWRPSSQCGDALRELAAGFQGVLSRRVS